MAVSDILDISREGNCKGLSAQTNYWQRDGTAKQVGFKFDIPISSNL